MDYDYGMVFEDIKTFQTIYLADGLRDKIVKITIEEVEDEQDHS